ncbi:MAG: hypothetical protein ACLSUU_02825 [Christensenellales bacterium]|jgi:hypothetical protein
MDIKDILYILVLILQSATIVLLFVHIAIQSRLKKNSRDDVIDELVKENEKLKAEQFQVAADAQTYEELFKELKDKGLIK